MFILTALTALAVYGSLRKILPILEPALNEEHREPARLERLVDGEAIATFQIAVLLAENQLQRLDASGLRDLGASLESLAEKIESTLEIAAEPELLRCVAVWLIAGLDLNTPEGMTALLKSSSLELLDAVKMLERRKPTLASFEQEFGNLIFGN